MPTTSRLEAEAMLDDQGAALRRIRRLIDDRTPWAEWPKSDAGIFLAAIDPTDAGEFERAKAWNLVRHLFRFDVPELPGEPIAERLDLADRVRADLAGLVRLGAGRHLGEAPSVVPSRT